MMMMLVARVILMIQSARRAGALIHPRRLHWTRRLLAEAEVGSPLAVQVAESVEWRRLFRLEAQSAQKAAALTSAKAEIG